MIKGRMNYRRGTPTITVVVPTYNRLPVLKKVITALENQTLRNNNFEVIVVSDGSSDGTNEYLTDYGSHLVLRAIFQNNSGPATARNRGVKEAIGEIILFLDDDVVPAPNLVEAHQTAHRHYCHEDVVIIGPMLTPADFELSPWTKWMQERLGEQYNSMTGGEWEPTARQFYTGNASLPRSMFLKFNGFDPSLRRAEDVEFAYRLSDNGIRFIFCGQAKGFHYEARSFDSWLKIAYSYGRNDVIFHRQKGQDWLLPVVKAELKKRNFITRFLVWLFLGHKRMMRLISRTGKFLIVGDERLKLKLFSRIACSVLFNLHYYQGVVDELGGRDQFYANYDR